jgi:hypothetical protein
MIQNTMLFVLKWGKKAFFYMSEATAIAIFFRRQAEKSLGLLRIKLQKITFCRNAMSEKLYLIK